MAYFNEENTVEQMLINAAGQCGWIYVEPQFVPRLPDEVLVVEWLMEALLALNPITPEQAEQVIYKLRACITSGGASDELITANDKFRKLLLKKTHTHLVIMAIISTFVSLQARMMNIRIVA